MYQWILPNRFLFFFFFFLPTEYWCLDPIVYLSNSLCSYRITCCVYSTIPILLHRFHTKHFNFLFCVLDLSVCVCVCMWVLHLEFYLHRPSSFLCHFVHFYSVSHIVLSFHLFFLLLLTSSLGLYISRVLNSQKECSMCVYTYFGMCTCFVSFARTTHQFSHSRISYFFHSTSSSFCFSVVFHIHLILSTRATQRKKPAYHVNY